MPHTTFFCDWGDESDVATAQSVLQCVAEMASDLKAGGLLFVPNADVAAADRYSIAMFIDPDAQSVVAVDERFVQAGEQPKYSPTTGLEYLLFKLKEAQGTNSDPQAPGNQG